MLTNRDIEELTAFRRDLHRSPKLSGGEVHTAGTIADALTRLGPDRLIRNLGGHGVAAVFDSGEDGPTLLFPAELDALSIEERSGAAWSSKTSGVAHLCGHDGHMTMLVALARLLSRQRPGSGRCVLMFQPAEEDGSDVRAVVADPAYQDIRPDWVFAIHNKPGLPFGHVGIRPGLINCASRGLAISACRPDMLAELQGLGTGGVLDDDFRLSTITHVAVGEPTFGITPGDATIFVTLRASRDEITAEAGISALAARHGLTCRFDIHDDFAASLNDPEAVDIACGAMAAIIEIISNITAAPTMAVLLEIAITASSSSGTRTIAPKVSPMTSSLSCGTRSTTIGSSSAPSRPGW